MEDDFSMDGVGDALELIQAYYICCAIYFYLLHQLHSSHHALDPRGWGPRSNGGEKLPPTLLVSMLGLQIKLAGDR